MISLESTKFWFIQPQNLLIIRTTKYLVNSTKLLGFFKHIEIFAIDSTKKYISINQTFV